MKIIEDYEYGQFYGAAFEWMEGKCLFDYWNFEKYQRDTAVKSPKEKFKQLFVSKKLSTVDVLFLFYKT